MSLRLASGLCIALLLAASRAGAVIMVFGGGPAEMCSKAAFDGLSDPASIRLCDEALLSQTLSAADRAATFTNRGVMWLRRREFAAAREDFDAAIALAPDVGEAWLNRGAVALGEKHYQQSLADIDRGIALGVTEPEKAYYDRGLAHEGLNDAASAYFDYQRAATLKPDWVLPRQELLRFSVTRR